MPEPLVYGPVGEPFIELESVDSTNNYALSQLHAGMACHGMVILAQEQYAGKGQRGKKWAAQKGDGLLFSVVIRPHPFQLSQQYWLSAAIALAARDFLASHTAGDMSIKWPNDLYWQDRKAGGILIENIVGSGGQGETGAPAIWKWAVAGIGININQAAFSKELINPVSLRQITGKTWDTKVLAGELCAVLNKWLGCLKNITEEELFREFNQHLYRKDQPTRFRRGNKVFEATVKKVLPSGELEVEHSFTESIRHGETEWLLI